MTTIKRLLPSADIDALVGDIVEESKQRSALWYWMQILAVLVVGTFREVRGHWLLTLRATAVGWSRWPPTFLFGWGSSTDCSSSSTCFPTYSASTR